MDVERMCGGRESQAVIACARGDDTAPAHIGREFSERVGGAANLERARELQTLELEKNIAAEECAERFGAPERCAFDEGGESNGGVAHIATRREHTDAECVGW